MSEYVTLRNNITGQRYTLELPFTEKEYVDALENLGITFDSTYLLVDNMPAGIEVAEYVTYIPLSRYTDAYKDVVLLNLCVEAYGDTDAIEVDTYVEDIGVDDGVEFINLCVNSNEVCLYWWDNGTHYEGLGHYLLDDTGDIPDDLSFYFDYETYGRDNDDGVYVHENFGHFPENGAPDLEAFDEDEIYDELSWDIEYEPVAKRTVNINDDALFKFL